MSAAGRGTDPEVLTEVERLHAEVDRRARELLARLPGPLTCRSGCADCCQDDLTVFPVEADLIRARTGQFLRTARPAPAGACAFLDSSGACRIYAFRPYVCRTQGLPLRWIEGGGEHRDICPLNTEPLGVAPADLAPEQCWTLGEFESRLAGLQAGATGFAEQLPRVALRSLFDVET